MTNEKSIIRPTDEAEISIKDILAFCFLHWRSAICLCLTVGLLTGIYKGFKTFNSQSISNPKLTTEKASGLTPQLNKLESSIDSLQTYINESDFMKIDPTKESKSEVTLIIKPSTDNYDMAKSLKSAYTSQLKNGDYLKPLAKKFKLNPNYISELISINTNESTYDSSKNIENNNSIKSDGESSLALTISVIGKDNKTTEAIIDEVLNEAKKANTALSSEILSHELLVTSVNTYTIYDKVTSDSQIARQKNLMDLKVALKNFKTTFQDDLSHENALTINPAPDSSKRFTIKFSRKWFAIGAVGTFLLYGFILCLVYIMSHTPLTKEQFESRFKFFILGEFSGGKAKFYKNNSSFDKWLRKIMGMKKYDEEYVYNLITANLNVYAKDKKSFLLVGSSSDKLAKIVSNLESRKTDCSFSYVNDLTENPESRTKLSKIDNVIFVAEYGVSNYDTICEELSLVYKSEKDIAGAIMI